MHRWKEDFLKFNNNKCVHIHKNGDFDNKKILYMESDWDFVDFLQAASQRLEMVPVATRLFTQDGVEINDCMMIEDNDNLFLSNNDENFISLYENNARLNADNNDEKSDDKSIPTIVGGYLVKEMLGKGGFGEVRIGEHHLTGERVALKFLSKKEIHSLGAAERTNTEIQCLTALKHHNIIRLLQHFENPNYLILVFELMEGGDLMQFLHRRAQENQEASPSPSGSTLPKASLTEEESRQVFYQILSGLSYAHNHHICHRDLKLENILLKGNSLSHIKIADFGLSEFIRPGSLIKSECGTLSFLAPEVFKGVGIAGPPLDVWSLGVILFALLCGRLPFEGPDLLSSKRPRENIIRNRIIKGQYKIDDNIGPEAKDLVKRMLHTDPSERLTIPEIFNHIWVRNTIPNQDPTPTISPKIIGRKSLVKQQSQSNSLSSLSSLNPLTLSSTPPQSPPLTTRSIQDIDQSLDSLNILVNTPRNSILSNNSNNIQTLSTSLSQQTILTPRRNLVNSASNILSPQSSSFTESNLESNMKNFNQSENHDIQQDSPLKSLISTPTPSEKSISTPSSTTIRLIPLRKSASTKIDIDNSDDEFDLLQTSNNISSTNILSSPTIPSSSTSTTNFSKKGLVSTPSHSAVSTPKRRTHRDKESIDDINFISSPTNNSIEKPRLIRGQSSNFQTETFSSSRSRKHNLISKHILSDSPGQSHKHLVNSSTNSLPTSSSTTSSQSSLKFNSFSPLPSTPMTSRNKIINIS